MITAIIINIEIQSFVMYKPSINQLNPDCVNKRYPRKLLVKNEVHASLALRQNCTDKKGCDTSKFYQLLRSENLYEANRKL